MIMLRIDAAGTRDGKPHAVRWEMVDCGEPGGMLAMSRAVGFTASIVAQMILNGEITRAGVGCPARDVPAPALFDALGERGMTIRRTTQS